MFRQCVVWYVGVPFWRKTLPVPLGHDLEPVLSTSHLCSPFLQKPNWCCHPLIFFSSSQLVAVQELPNRIPCALLVVSIWTRWLSSCTVCAVDRLQRAQSSSFSGPGTKLRFSSTLFINSTNACCKASTNTETYR